MLQLIITILFCLCGGLASGQSITRFENKALVKILKKEGIVDLSFLSEMPVKGSIIEQNQINGTYYNISLEENPYKYFYKGRVFSCRAEGCSIPEQGQARGPSEYFDYCIFFDKNKTVQLVRVYNYQATHGYEVTSRGWLKQFIGYNGSPPLKVNKDIDGISGATISVHAITNDVVLKTALIRSLK